MLHIHLALQLPCIALYALTYSQSGAANVRRPPVDHIKPPLGEPSRPLINPSDVIGPRLGDVGVSRRFKSSDNFRLGLGPVARIDRELFSSNTRDARHDGAR